MSDTDRELLELAALAMGVDIREYYPDESLPTAEQFDRIIASLWNPLADDGDAFRVAVKLGIEYRRITMPHSVGVQAYDGTIQAVFESYGDDPLAATRRAIVRAAAEIGTKLKTNGNNSLDL
jgi:hypothetical protein